MKFGNYNLATETEKQNRLYIFRIKKVKNTANYIVGKFNHKINTIRTIKKINNYQKNRRNFNSESPLSYRASLFDKESIYKPIRHFEDELPKKRIVGNTYEKFTPTDFYHHHNQLYAPSEISENDGPCVFDKVKFSKINNAISGKRQHKMLKNVYFTIKSNKCSNLRNLYESTRFQSLKRSPIKMEKPNNQDTAKNKMDLSTLLKTTISDEKTEYDILKDYFDSMSFTEIAKDKDFKNYLKQKNYQDAIDYIYSGSVWSSLRDGGDKSSIYENITKSKLYNSTASEILKRYYDIDLDIITESNDCDSIKQEKQKSIDRRKYYNKENSQFFCKSNKEFDDYYKKNTQIFYEANKKFDDTFFQSLSIEAPEYYRKDDKYRNCKNLYDNQVDYYEDVDIAPGNETDIEDIYQDRHQQNYVCSTMPNRKHTTNKSHNMKDLDDREEKKLPKLYLAQGNKTLQFDKFDKFEKFDRFQKFYEDDDEATTLFKKYQTYPLKKKPKKNYQQILKYCEKSLTTYTTIDRKLEKWKKSSKKEYSEKNYNKIIKAFVKLRGFDSVESYITYHYGRILDKSFDAKLKSMLKESAGELTTPISQSHKPRTAVVISKPILTNTTQSSALANIDSLPPPYTSGSYFDHYTNYFYKRHQQHANNHKKCCKTRIIDNLAYEDCFKNYNYVDHHTAKSPSSSVDVIENPNKRTLFKFVEDLQCNDIKIEYLLTGKKIIPKASDEQSYPKPKSKTEGSRVGAVLSKSKNSRLNQAQNDDNVYESIYVENTNNISPNRNAGNERSTYKKLEEDDHRVLSTSIIQKPIV